VEGDRLANELLHLLLGVAHDANAWQVRAIGAPGVTFVLDYD
jgi:hypothetical protein